MGSSRSEKKRRFFGQQDPWKMRCYIPPSCTPPGWIRLACRLRLREGSGHRFALLFPDAVADIYCVRLLSLIVPATRTWGDRQAPCKRAAPTLQQSRRRLKTHKSKLSAQHTVYGLLDAIQRVKGARCLQNGSQPDPRGDGCCCARVDGLEI